eukprot:CAMPEP_0179909416 /NCGR_PEP_ID=MMETSP0982-20121206/45208_1 /TAXON_ID=483367 /ORGANISM="non described non described, Strain CCMP 2436" /LENGTH=183 /DNA_ID=CAMNT_0021810873 /DNA_START=218 /DNA_END=769 /DNA_ORIENTATION=+
MSRCPALKYGSSTVPVTAASTASAVTSPVSTSFETAGAKMADGTSNVDLPATPAILSAGSANFKNQAWLKSCDMVGRSLGSTTNAAFSIDANSTETDFSLSINLPRPTRCLSSCKFDASKGKTPVVSAKAMTPNAHTSAAPPSYGTPLIISGELYNSEPHGIVNLAPRERTASPKSVSLQRPQ